MLHGEPGGAPHDWTAPAGIAALARPVPVVVRDDADAVDAILGEAQLR